MERAPGVGRSGRAGAALLLAGALLVAGCGAPEYHYVKNADAQLYFKVPRGWGQIDQAGLDRAENSGSDPEAQTTRLLDKLSWSVAYDDADPPSPDHVFGGPMDQPVAYAKVQRLLPTQQGAVSLDGLRNLVLPVTDAAREQAEGAGRLLPGFELLNDEVVTPGAGVRGVHEVFSYRVAGQRQTFDLTALVNDDATEVYFLLVRCSAACYADRTGELAEIVQSFTVRGSS